MMMTMIMRPNTSPQSSHTRAMWPTSCQPVLEQTASFVGEAPPKKRKTSSKVRRRRSGDEESTVLRGKDEAAAMQTTSNLPQQGNQAPQLTEMVSTLPFPAVFQRDSGA
ncbi:hypothetical protein AMECASPLE_014818 [Ameca splendens]|uniref:Uncharacterized protein n=1 Tax=Ameca splendens TaxID=208324 RepID=A0ABV0Z0B9_9TELE